MPLAGRQIPGPQLAFIAHKAGMPLDDLAMFLAIARRESQWYEGAWNFNRNTGDRSYGLWQINMIDDLMAERLRIYKLQSADDLYKADINARVAVSLYKVRRWNDWGAYHDGGYRDYLSMSEEAVAVYRQRLLASGDRLHMGGEPDCDSI